MKFLLTKESGRLATWLRILGFDAAYSKEDKASAVIIQALKDDRIILTRNRRLLRHSAVGVILIEREKIKGQLAELLKKLNIQLKPDMMFTRCVICNEGLEQIKKDKIKNRVPEYVFNTQESFVTCPKCQRIYWQGTHWGNVTKAIEEITDMG